MFDGVDDDAAVHTRVRGDLTDGRFQSLDDDLAAGRFISFERIGEGFHSLFDRQQGDSAARDNAFFHSRASGA